MSSGLVLEMRTLVTGRCYLRKCSIRYAQDVRTWLRLTFAVLSTDQQHKTAGDKMRGSREKKKIKTKERERNAFRKSESILMPS